MRDLTALRVHTGLATPQLLGASAGIAWLKGAADVLVGVDVNTGFRRHRCIVPAESGLLLAGSTVVQSRGAEVSGWNLDGGDRQWTSVLDGDELVSGTVGSIIALVGFQRVRLLSAITGEILAVQSLPVAVQRDCVVRSCGELGVILIRQGVLVEFSLTSPSQIRSRAIKPAAKTEWRDLLWCKRQAWLVATTETAAGPSTTLVPAVADVRPVTIGAVVSWLAATDHHVLAISPAQGHSELITLDPVSGARFAQRSATGESTLVATTEQAAYFQRSTRPELALGRESASGFLWTRIPLPAGRYGLPCWHATSLLVTLGDDLLIARTASLSEGQPRAGVIVTGVAQAVTEGERVDITYAGQSVAVIGKHDVHGRVTFTREPTRTVQKSDRVRVTDHGLIGAQLKVHRWSLDGELVLPKSDILPATALWDPFDLVEPRASLAETLARLVVHLPQPPALLERIVATFDRDANLRERWHRLGFELLDGDRAAIDELGELDEASRARLHVLPFARLSSQLAIFVRPRGATSFEHVAIWWYQDGGDLEWCASSFEAWFDRWLAEKVDNDDPAADQLWDDLGLDRDAAVSTGEMPSWFEA